VSMVCYITFAATELAVVGSVRQVNEAHASTMKFLGRMGID